MISPQSALIVKPQKDLSEAESIGLWYAPALAKMSDSLPENPSKEIENKKLDRLQF